MFDHLATKSAWFWLIFVFSSLLDQLDILDTKQLECTVTVFWAAMGRAGVTIVNYWLLEDIHWSPDWELYDSLAFPRCRRLGSSPLASGWPSCRSSQGRRGCWGRAAPWNSLNKEISYNWHSKLSNLVKFSLKPPIFAMKSSWYLLYFDFFPVLFCWNWQRSLGRTAISAVRTLAGEHCAEQSKRSDQKKRKKKR